MDVGGDVDVAAATHYRAFPSMRGGFLRCWGILALVSVGCGGGAERAARPAADPCRLVTRAEAEAALGTPTGEGVRRAGGTVCRYQAADGLVGVTVGVRPAGRDHFERQLADAEASWDERRVAIPELGAEAFLVGRQVIVAAPAATVTITIISRLPAAESRARATALMATALARLG